MAVTGYFFRFDAQGEAPIGTPSAEALGRLTRHFGEGEWLCVRMPGYCDLYCADGDSPAIQDIAKALRAEAILPDNTTQQRREDDREAMRSFLRTAAGIAEDRDELQNIEVYQEAFTQALELGFAGSVFQALFRKALHIAEKVRTETEFAKFAVRPETAVRELAEKILGNTARAAVYVLGYNRTAGDILAELRRTGTRSIHFAGDVPAGVAAAFSAQTTPMSRLNTLPPETDILLACEADADVEKILSGRLNRRRTTPLLLFDLTEGEAYCRKLRERDDLYLYGKADIRLVIDYNKNERRPMLQAVERILDQAATEFSAWLESEQRFEFAGMLGSDSRMQRIFQLIERIAPTDITVLIDGESGTGKELIARAIHRYSARAQKRFYTVNCGAIPDNLLESELFGHVRGAFTGAISDKQGLFEAADGGTVFLDEIGELPLHLQVKLLRFLQEGEIRKVGSNDTLKLNVRVIAASNRNLADMVETGLFRSDLYYRLNVIQITLPPLRERRGDIPLMAHHFLKHFAQKMNRDMMSFSPEAMQTLVAYHWPGNIRELENAVERAVALSIGRAISLYNLPEALRTSPPLQTTETAPASATDEYMTLKDIEKKHILETLESCNWNYESASKYLGIGRTTLWRKLREYGYSPQ